MTWQINETNDEINSNDLVIPVGQLHNKLNTLLTQLDNTISEYRDAYQDFKPNDIQGSPVQTEKEIRLIPSNSRLIDMYNLYLQIVNNKFKFLEKPHHGQNETLFHTRLQTELIDKYNELTKDSWQMNSSQKLLMPMN